MPDIAEQMLTEALAAQKFTRKFFVVELDFSEESLVELEKQFDAAKYALRGGLSPENIDKLTGLWGAYLGEVLRRHTRGQWVTVAVDGIERPALRGAEQTVFPHNQVRARCDKGAAESIVQYFESLKATL